MSQYLTTPDNLLKSEDLFKIFSCYVLDELRPSIDISQLSDPKLFMKDNGEQLIQKFLDNSNHQLRMYGSAKEIAENLKIFRDFPFGNKFFRSDLNPYFSSAVLYDNLKGEKFVSKLDLLIILQNMAMKIFPGSNSTEMRINIMTPLVANENQHVKSLKFVKFDEKVFEEIEKEMREAAKPCIVYEHELAELEKQLSAGNFANFVSKFPRFDGKKKSKTDDAQMCELMKKYYSSLGPADRTGRMALFFNETLVMKTLQTIIDKRSKLFSGNGVPFVRVFEDGTERFVMKMELFHAISNVIGNKFKEEPHLFTTLSMEEVEKDYGNRLKNIEFLRTPIIRAKHRAACVKGYVPEEFGFLAADCLFDLLRNLMIGDKIFHRYSDPNLKPMEEIFDIAFETIFKPECKTPYFVREGALQMVTSTFTEFSKIIEFIPAKDIRNAKIDGFTVQNLKNELINLGLNKPFPEIENYAESVYSAVDSMKKEKYLRTCDLFEAVFHCQLICFFDKIPQFKTFIHNQNGCGTVLGYNCELCHQKESQKNLESLENEEEDKKRREIRELKEKISKLSTEKEELENQLKNLLITSGNKNTASECLICKSELNGDTMKCPMCRTHFHSKCALEYAKNNVKCPSCKKEIQNSMIFPK